MGDKLDKNKNKKKLTKKELKALNHLKLMEGQKDRNAITATNKPTDQKDKKAA